VGHADGSRWHQQLSIASAAEVALMGQARGQNTLFGHLRWTAVIALGYFASISVHPAITGGDSRQGQRRSTN